MEYGLREREGTLTAELKQSLNPCFNGIWSASKRVLGLEGASAKIVLILVLMEYGLRLRNMRL